MWKRLPLSFRNNIHFLIHRFNSSRLLLRLFSWRHQVTCKKLAKRRNVWLRVGESRNFDGWISTNYQVLVKNFLDGRKTLKGVTNLQRVYLDNVIEHLPKREGTEMLINIFSAMEAKSVIRLATPDLESICHKYLSRNPQHIIELENDMANHGLEVTSMPDLLRVTFCAFGHEKGFIYDFSTLKNILEDIGFTNVEAYRPGVSKRPELHGLESRVGTSDQWSQMCLEAIKP